MITVSRQLGLALLVGASLPALADDAQLQRGEYLARAADCVACHTVQGGKPFAGGLEFKLPFGSLYAPNITPDTQTGIGTWTDDDFVGALQKGVGKDGKHYYPAFPYTAYTKMSRDEILAIKAYLFSQPAVKQPNKPDTLTFPFNQRWGMAIWNVLFHDDERFTADPKRSPEWNRGAFLVEGPGHCGECHTPRNLMQALDSGHSLAGNVIEGWNAYNISSDVKHGIGAWDEQALVNFMRTGSAPGFGVASGPMAEVVENSLQYLSTEDLKAIAVYLKSSPARDEGVTRPDPAVRVEPSVQPSLGQKVFADACAACHRPDGHGNQTPVATLLGLKTVNDPGAHNLIGVILQGHPATRVEQRMPAFAKAYNDEELAAVSTYILQRFGTTNSTVAADAITKRRE
ncbi:cytochrome c [Pseudomonas sp. GD03842]|uniref:cytochrome c n=1 Tax=Pseudomonas sp. GD03842 TaxID=2975385 RepID=UPI0024494362|nr:cytochrome c [Pseudomonas sp. GD03842]MDH0748801.1 cytochrome c [Pseudomonas sp. GD03842]